MWSSPDVVGLFSINVVSFSRNVVLSDPLFSLNSVSKPRILSVRADYVLGSLQLAAFIGMSLTKIFLWLAFWPDAVMQRAPRKSPREIWLACKIGPTGTEPWWKRVTATLC